ncbi:hypothetical protein [Candidatus Nitrosotenuis uzonensis]|uniref:Uncharacterized protein n=1 Tax=Candidatus Nitrosotenuis uzonensis TaxID=1407055 RepID=A0A812EXZ0_9ARCH|nr:hypothetical protein [Candidatus Nitrosotenuis uzonensis]CAE6487263.1 conserved hypothetical protein [Candidatus Nitrosotenuis uzonensis]
MKSILLLFFLSIAIIPAFGEYVEPSQQEHLLYNSMRQEFEKLDVPKRDVSDVLSSFDEPVRISIPCDAADINNFINATISTRLAKFDTGLAHTEGAVTGGIYIWKCAITSYAGNITIECQNELMLNPEAIKSSAEKDPRIQHVEEMVVFYHELLHGQLMMDAIKSSDSWKNSTCNKKPQDKLAYSYTDASHQVISPLQTEFAQKLVEKHGGIMRVEKITPDETLSGSFTKKVGSLYDYPEYTDGGISISARSYNISTLQITSDKADVIVSGTLGNKTQSGTIWLYVFGKQASAEPVLPAEQPETPSPSEQEIPSWVKRTAGWWADNTIGEKDFVLGIEYLVQNKIISVPYTAKSASSGSMPLWIKTNAGWWASGMISDSEFVFGIQYLIQHGIIKVKSESEAPVPQTTIESPIQKQTFVQVSADVVERNSYKSSQIQITGKVENYKAGTSVLIEIVKPDGKSFQLKGMVTNKGVFTVPLIIDGNYQPGKYIIHVTYNDHEIGSDSLMVN